MHKCNPGIEHERRKEMLETIATLSGYDKDFSGRLPDGTQPDVLRVDPLCGSIFLGEAKDTEAPGCAETFGRLSNYMSWFRLLTGEKRGSTFVVCFGEESHENGWKNMLSDLAEKVGFVDFKVETIEVEEQAFFVWVKLGQRT